MWYTIPITLLIQYGLWLLGRATEVSTFWVPSMILHFLFIIQTIAVLYLIYIYITTVTDEHLKGDKLSFINTIKNLVLFLSWLIIAWNIIIIFFWDKLTEIFNIL